MKKEHLLIIVALSVAVVFYFFSGMGAPIKNYPPKNNIVVAFGDSLVEGYGSTAGHDFVSLLSQKLNRQIINLGVSGNTTAEGLARIDTVLARDPGTVVVLFGGNDYLRNIPEAETFDNLRQIVSTLQSKGIFVVLLGVQGGIFNDHFQASFEKLAKETGAVYVPNVLLGLFGNPKYMFDAVHPNDLGYAKIADKVYGVIRNYIW